MRKIVLSLFCLSSTALAFAAEVPLKEVTPLTGSMCETRSSTISDEHSGESVTATCTKCADTSTEAAVSATLCASRGVKMLAVFVVAP